MISKANHPRACGFTLLEILLVLALVVAIFALAIPALRKPMETARLRSSADLIRAEFAKTRVDAMKTGRIQMFRCQQAGNSYQIIAWEADAIENTPSGAATDRTANQSLAARDEADGANDDLYAAETEELPEDIEFFALSMDEDLRAEQLLIDQTPAAAVTTEGQYLRPILFYADGTSSTAQLVLKNSQNRAVTISLRGLTGTVRIGEVTTLAEAAQ